jgi:imidazolonepropionase
LRNLKQAPLDLVATVYCRLPQPAEGRQEPSGAALGRILTEVLPRVRRRRLARFAEIQWGETASPEQYGRFLQSAAELGFGCRIHADQPGADAAVMLAAEHNVVSIDHLEHATPAAADLLGRSSTMATLLPSAAFRTGGRTAPARALIDAGVPVALATNFNPQHTPALNMQTVVSLACMSMGLTPAEAIAASTINGAHVLGCAGRVGSLEPGKWADILILNLSDYREMAGHFGMNLACLTLKRGACIYEEGSVPSRGAAILRPTSPV